MSAASVSGPAVTAAHTSAIPADRLARITKTSQQFEAIFLRQIMAAARKASPGDTMTSSPGEDTFIEMQDAHFADIASQTGAFGLAKMIEKQLIRQASSTGKAAASTPLPAPANPVPGA